MNTVLSRIWMNRLENLLLVLKQIVQNVKVFAIPFKSGRINVIIVENADFVPSGRKEQCYEPLSR